MIARNRLPKSAWLLLIGAALAAACSDGSSGGKSSGPVGPNQPPTASICIDRLSGPLPLHVSVDGWDSTDPEGSVLLYDWDLGDGSVATGRATAHTYVTAGTYTIALVVTDDGGDTASATVDINVGSAGAPGPPLKPACGPLAPDYSHAAVTSQLYGVGETAFWLFEPDGPKPAMAPVVLFLHGWTAVDPASYMAWIHHIVQRGHIVIYPVYQIVPTTPFSAGTDNAIQGVKDALVELANLGHVTPDLTRVGAVGHSFGGMMTANFAVRAAAEGLPPIQAIMPAEPGAFPTEWEDYTQIPGGTLILSIAGEEDVVVGDILALWIFNSSIAVPSTDKDFLLLRTDNHGSPGLISDHRAPGGLIDGQGVDAFDFFGFWKWWDALTDAAWYGTNREIALGDTPEQRFLGTWSDGIPVVEPVVTD